jgi:hypothetical protein
MARVKGTALKSTIEFLKSHMGDEPFQSLLKKLTPEEAVVVTSPILMSGWYEFSFLRKLMKLAKGQVKLDSGRSLAWELGRFSAEAALSGIYKLFFKVTDVGFIVKKASYLFPTLYDSGVMEVVDLQPNGAVMRVKEFNEPSPEFCDRLQGWMERTVELTGRKRVTIEHPKCTSRGDAYCEFHGRWE